MSARCLTAVSLCASLLGGCGSRAMLFELPVASPELGYLLAGRDDLALRLIGRVEPPVEVTVEADEAWLFWVGLSEAAIRARAPGYDSGRRAEAELFLRAEGTLSADSYDDPIITRLPADAEILRIDLDEHRTESTSAAEVPALADLGLELPSNPDFCDPDPGARLTAYARAEQLTLTATRATNLEGVDLAELDEDHLLVLGADLLFVLERGGDMPAAGSGALLAGPELAPITYARWLALDPKPAADGTRRAWIVGWWEDAQGLRGAAIVLSVSRERVLRLPDPAFAPEIGARLPALETVTVAEDGTVVLTGQGGWLLVREPSGPAFRRPVDPNGLLVGTVGELAFSGPERASVRALVGISGFSIAEGDPITGRWTVYEAAPEISPLLVPSRDFYGLVRGPGGEYWASGDQGVVVRSSAQGLWAAFDPVLPPELRACDGERLRLQRNPIKGLAASRSELFLASRGCNTLYRIDPVRSCVAGLAHASGEAVGAVDRHSHVRTGARHVYSIGGELRVYSAPLPEPR